MINRVPVDVNAAAVIDTTTDDSFTSIKLPQMKHCRTM